MIANELRQLVDHMEWADALIWHTVLSIPESHNDERTRKLLHHKHEVQLVYLQIWRGDTMNIPDLSSFNDLSSMHQWSRDGHTAIKKFIMELTPEKLEENVEFPWARLLTRKFGEVHPVTVRESILQVVMHSTYHRGQINAHLRQLGGVPPLTDFIAWVWMGKPAAGWYGKGM